ncbi:ABC transporter ATP-binding protein [Paenibacillus thermotolerans]|uniref:ABC transporter ATP-binding protein n=1 Tax=Paenibacillus thermotolerans TaxID=3027807 RepID=UPI0023682B33|nr:MULTISPECIES: ABC transporter ATP-binding protein [unclassified Paenibacillus]
MTDRNSAQQHHDVLVDVRNLKKHFSAGGRGFGFGLGGKKDREVKAVDDVTFQIRKGETFGLVGESGCGKSTTGRSIIRLYDVTSGEVRFDGTDIARLNERGLKPFRKRMQAIFQDPYSSLNPGMTVADLVAEPMEIHGRFTRKEREEQVVELLDKVGLKKEHLNRFPHEFSGGQRQRIGIARALSVKPEFIVCDEPISALDVSVQAQVVNTLEDLQQEFGLTYLFIAHDLSMVRHISDRIAVMYLGKIVEIADSETLYRNALHPYTKALLSAIPVPDPKKAAAAERIVLQGELPSPMEAQRGCKFRARCPFATARCAEEEPAMTQASPGHEVACHLYNE